MKARFLRPASFVVLGTMLVECLQPTLVLAQVMEGSASASSVSSINSSEAQTSSVSSSAASSEVPLSAPAFSASSSSSLSSDSSSSAAYSSVSSDSSESSVSSVSSVSSSLSSSSSSSEAQILPLVTDAGHIQYGSMMNRVLEFRRGTPVMLTDGTADTKSTLVRDLGVLRSLENQKMLSLSLPDTLIQKQLATIDAITATVDQPLLADPNAMQIPENPSSFEKVEDDTTVHLLRPSDIKLINLQDEWKPEATLLEQVKLFFFPQAKADPSQHLPVLADVQTDGKEIVLTDEIRTLADSLDRNPVKIINYVRTAIAFEPYSTSKKGATGCLRDKLCNDVDTAALTIALYRAAGIPARYRKAAALLTKSQAQLLLGVDNPKSVYYLLSANGRPTYVVGSAVSNPDDTSLQNADFSSVTHFYTEWFGVEAFVDYDERGGYYSSFADFSGAQNDSDVADLLQPTQKKTWIYLDPTLQGTSRGIKPVPEGVEMLSFIETHLKTADTRTPVDHYKSLVGIDVMAAASQTIVVPSNIAYDILPPTPPYALGTKEDITTGAESTLPDLYRHRVTITLRDASTNTPLLSQLIYAYQMHDQEFELSYQGATAQDQSIIDSYGGIYATPPGVVEIVPVLSDGEITVTGTTPVRIGQSVILKFSMGRRSKPGVLFSTSSEKFSVAGNTEGIYMTFGTAKFDPARSTKELVLLGGNASIARYYVAKVLATERQLAGVFDQSIVPHFTRAVVTDNRHVTMVNGMPTTFDFKGLSIDASVELTNGSRRTSFDTGSYPLFVLLGAQSSYEEGAVFTELAGLNAVSTISGITYAAARPEEYTLHTISSANASVIDTLQLSENTKDNMRDDIDAGARVITPNKPITDGVFSGIVYASLGPSRLRFAIGEQAQNGGFTATTFRNGDTITVKIALVPGKTFTNIQGPKEMKCLYTAGELTSMQSTAGYSQAAHGQPCYKGTYTFGTRTHIVILTQKAANFKIGADAGYWETLERAESVILNESPLADLGTLTFEERDFDFDPQTGTFIWPGKYTIYFSADGTVDFYFNPNKDSPHAFGTFGITREKLKQYVHCVSKKSSCLAVLELGYPTSNRLRETTSGHRKMAASVFIQHFVGGKVFEHYSPDLSNAAYYSPHHLIVQLIAAGGFAQYGVPTSDPTIDGSTKIVTQSLESGYAITANGLSGELSPLGIVKGEELKNDEAFQEGVYDALLEEGLYGFAINIGTGLFLDAIFAGALSLKGPIAKKVGTAVIGKVAGKIALRIVPGVGWALVAYTGYDITKTVEPLAIKCNSTSLPDNEVPNYYCGKAWTHAFLYGLGIGTGAAASRIASSAVRSSFSIAKGVPDVLASAARLGKTRLFGLMDPKIDVEAGAKFSNEIGAFTATARTNVFRDINALDDVALKAVIQNKNILRNAYDRYVELPKLQSLIGGYTTEETFLHGFLGKINEKGANIGKFGGGHGYSAIERKVSNEFITILNSAGAPYGKLSDVPTVTFKGTGEHTGVRAMKIVNKDAEIHTVYPEWVTPQIYKDIGEQVVAGGIKAENGIDFVGVITRMQNGVTYKIPIKVFMEVGKIKAHFPDKNFLNL